MTELTKDSLAVRLYAEYIGVPVEQILFHLGRNEPYRKTWQRLAAFVENLIAQHTAQPLHGHIRKTFPVYISPTGKICTSFPSRGENWICQQAWVDVVDGKETTCVVGDS